MFTTIFKAFAPKYTITNTKCLDQVHLNSLFKIWSASSSKLCYTTEAAENLSEKNEKISNKSNSNNENITEEIQGEEVKKSASPKSLLFRPSRNFKKYNEVNSIVSYIVTINSIAGVSMNRNYEITGIKEFPFTMKESGANYNLSYQVNKVNEFLRSFPSDTTYALTEGRWIWKSFGIRMHVHFLQGIIAAFYNHNNSSIHDCRNIQISRSKAANFFLLNIKGVRASSTKLVKEILQSGEWKNHQIHFPENIKVTPDVVLIKNRIFDNQITEDTEESNMENWSKITEPLQDAFLHALLFMHFTRTDK